MPEPLRIYSASHFFHAVDEGLPALKPVLQQLCGKKIRRIDRFTQLALIGSFQCKGALQLPEQTGIYLSSIYGSLSNTATVLRDIYQQGELPRPLNFINTVSNTACFYLAEQLGLASCNQFVTRREFTVEAGLKLASLDLETGKVVAALVGVVSEAGARLDEHRSRLQIDHQYAIAEGSHWLYVAHDLPGHQPIAIITAIEEPLSAQMLLDSLQGHTAKMTSQVAFGDRISHSERQALVSAMLVTEGAYVPARLRHEFTTAFHLHGYLQAEAGAEQLLIIDKSERGLYSLLCVQR